MANLPDPMSIQTLPEATDTRNTGTRTGDR